MRLRAIFITVLCLPVPTLAQQRQQGSSPGWPCAGTVDPAYVRLAEGTGGTALPFHPTEVSGAGVEMAASMRHDETVFRAGGQVVAEGLYEFNVPVDSTIESVYFLLSMQCLQVAEILTPTGDTLNVGAPGVEYHRFEAIHLAVVPKPAPGIWKVTLGGRGLLTFFVKATTALRLRSVDYRERGARLKSESKLGKKVEIEAMMTGAPRDLAFQFVGANAAAIRRLDLTLSDESDDSRSYVGEATTPTTSFRVAVTGYDANGFLFQRVEERLSMADH